MCCPLFERPSVLARCGVVAIEFDGAIERIPRLLGLPIRPVGEPQMILDF
jgi:hypothetical protein